MINSSPINAVAINAEAEDFGPLGSASILFAQTVGYPTGSTGIVFKQVVGATGQASIDLSQTVFDETFVATSWNNWDVVVKVDGVDVGEALTDAGEIRIDAERSSARLAEFTMLLSGTIEAQSWTGKAVTIDWIQNNGAAWRLFTGVIVEPVLNIANLTILCRCTDDLQRIIDNHTNEQIKTLTGGYWSKYVFDETAVGWNYLQDLLSAQPKSVEMDAFGTLRANSLQNKESPDFIYTNSLILDDSLQVNFGQRASLINWVDVTFSARFERLYQRNERVMWVKTGNFCFNRGFPIKFPSRDMVRDAVDSASWTIIAEKFTGLWESGVYYCGAIEPILWNNVYTEGVREFDIKAAFRWQQSVTDEFKIKITAPASIAEFGELKSDYSTSADFTDISPDWTGDNADYTQDLSGFFIDANHNRYQDQIDADALNNALQTAVAVAVERINASHRNIKLVFQLPLAPYLDLSHTLRINDTNLQAKGIVWRLQHVLNFSTAQAVTEIEMAISCGQSGADLPINVYSLPVHPNQNGPTVAQDIIRLQTWIGGGETSPALPENAWGVITNYESASEVHSVTEAQQNGAEEVILSGPPAELPDNLYPFEVRIKYPAIPDEKTQNKTDSIPHEIQIAVPDNLLTITA